MRAAPKASEAALPRGSARSPAVLAALAALAAFAGALALPFVYDDIPLIAGNAGLASPAALAQLAGPRYYAEFGVGNYHPLPLLAFAALRALAGPPPKPWVFHLLSLALHALNAALAALLARRLFAGWATPGEAEGRAAPQVERAALAAAALWAIHPLHTQTVFVAAFLPDLACATFSLGFCLLAAEGKALSRRGYGLFLLALACKETAAVIPLAALLLRPQAAGDRAHRRGSAASGVLGAAWSWARWRGLLYLLALYAAFRLAAIGDLEMLASSGTLAPGPAEPAWTPFLRLALALKLMVLPWPLTLMREPPAWQAAAPGFLAAGLLWAGLFLAGRARACVVGLGSGGGRPALCAGWMLLWLLPFLNLLPLGYARQYFAGRFLNERYLYLASLGLAWLGGGAWANLRQRRPRLAALGLAGCLAAFLAVDWHEARLYRDPVRHWSEIVRVEPRSFWARNILGVLLLARGEADAARTEFESALALGQRGAFERSVAWSNLGAALAMQGRAQESRRAYRHARVTDPSNREARRHAE